MPDSTNSTRSQACNGKRIAQVRKQLGWTQRDLALKAGFTQRLIAKAEAGQPVAPSSIHILAEALNEGGAEVTAVDLTCEPIALAREFMAALYVHQERLIEACKHFIAPEVVVRFAGDPATIPFAGTHQGIEAAGQAFKVFFQVIEFPNGVAELEGFEFVATEGGALVWGESWGHPIGMPITKPVSLGIRMDFEDGLLTSFDNRYDTQTGADHIIASGVLENRRSESS